PERPAAQQRLDVLAGHRQRADPDLRRRPRRAAQQQRAHVAGAAPARSSFPPSPPSPNVHPEVERMQKHSRIPRSLVAVAATAALVLLVVSQASGAKQASGTQLGESSPVLSNPNQQAIAHGEDLAAKQAGWSVKHLDANLSPSKQVSDVDTFVNLGV